MLGSSLRTGLGEGMILHTDHHPCGLTNLPLNTGKITQMHLAGDLVFSPSLLTRGCWAMWPEASELPAECLCEDTCNIFWLANHITCLSPHPGVGRAVLCFNSLCYISMYVYVHSQTHELLWWWFLQAIAQDKANAPGICLEKGKAFRLNYCCSINLLTPESLKIGLAEGTVWAKTGRSAAVGSRHSFASSGPLWCHPSCFPDFQRRLFC